MAGPALKRFTCTYCTCNRVFLQCGITIFTSVKTLSTSSPTTDNNPTPSHTGDDLFGTSALTNLFPVCLSVCLSCLLLVVCPYSVLQFEEVEEAYCSDEIAVVLVDNSASRGSELSAHLDDSDTVKIIITMSCDPHMAAALEESVKKSILESTQVRAGDGVKS